MIVSIQFGGTIPNKATFILFLRHNSVKVHWSFTDVTLYSLYTKKRHFNCDDNDYLKTSKLVNLQLCEIKFHLLKSISGMY